MTEPKSDANPKTAALLQQGLFHHGRGELPQAVERYVEVLKIEPENADALYYIAVVACQDGQYQQGADLAQRAIDVGPPQARVHNLLGQAFDRLEKPLEAIKAYDKAIAIDPNFAEAYGNRASIMADAGFPDEALKNYDKGLALNPKVAADWLNRGTLLQDMKRHDEALASIERALALMPDLSIAHRAKAVVLGSLNRAEDARISNETAEAIEKQQAPVRPRGDEDPVSH